MAIHVHDEIVREDARDSSNLKNNQNKYSCSSLLIVNLLSLQQKSKHLQ
jgi:hypothetical protein